MATKPDGADGDRMRSDDPVLNAESGEYIVASASAEAKLGGFGMRAEGTVTPAIPNQDKLEKLPMRAQAAFAARCARRVLPLLTETEERSRYDHAVERLVRLAERAASSVPVGRTEPLARVLASRIAHDEAGSPIAKAVALAGIMAGKAAMFFDSSGKVAMVTTLPGGYTCKSAAEAAAAAATHALVAVRDRFGGDSDTFAEAVHEVEQDYRLLHGAAIAKSWSDETPVPPEFFGDLWPDGTPNGWPCLIANEDGGTSPLRLYFDAEEFSPEDIARVIALLSDLYASIGGDRLVIDSTGILEATFEPQEAL